MIDQEKGTFKVGEKHLQKVYSKMLKKDVFMIYDRVALTPQLENNKFRWFLLTVFNIFLNVPGALFYIWWTRLRLISVIFEQEKNVL